MVREIISVLSFLHFQDNYFEEAFKMRNVLEELIKHRRGERKPTILGLREHIFTGRSVIFELLLIYLDMDYSCALCIA